MNRVAATTLEGIAVATAPDPQGITDPPIDELLDKTDSKYSLVIYAAKRARQINAYYSQLSEGMLEYVGPLVETHLQEKPLSIALREIDSGLLYSEPVEGAVEKVRT
ncbi:MAG: DNA-directed RNA polymerase subunit omega [Actinomycetes bacterium]